MAGCKTAATQAAQVPAPAIQAAPAAQPRPAVSYAEIQTLFRQSCSACHGAAAPQGGLVLESHESLMKGGLHGPSVISGNGRTSRLVQMLEGTVQPRMPMGGELGQPQIDMVRHWIDAGALNTTESEVKATAGGDDLKVPDIRPAVPVLGAIASLGLDRPAQRLYAGSSKAVHVLDLQAGKWTGALQGHAGLVRSIALSPDGKWLAAAGGHAARYGEVKIWNLQTGEMVRTLRGHSDAIYSVVFSPDGHRLATSSYDRLIKLWDVASGQEQKTLKEHVDAVYSVAFSPDGKYLASAAGDRLVKLWDVESGKRLVTMSESLDVVYTVAIHPSGKQIAAAGADKLIRIWNWSEGTATLLKSSFAHGDTVLKLLYSPDGETLVSAGADRVVKLWDAETLRERQFAAVQPDWVLDLAMSRDGRWLVAGRYDGSLTVYDLKGETAARDFILPR